MASNVSSRASSAAADELYETIKSRSTADLGFTELEVARLKLALHYYKDEHVIEPTDLVDCAIDLFDGCHRAFMTLTGLNARQMEDVRNACLNIRHVPYDAPGFFWPDGHPQTFEEVRKIDPDGKDIEVQLKATARGSAKPLVALSHVLHSLKQEYWARFAPHAQKGHSKAKVMKHVFNVAVSRAGITNVEEVRKFLMETDGRLERTLGDDGEE